MNFLVVCALFWSFNAFAESLPESSQIASTVYHLPGNGQDNPNIAAAVDIKANAGFIGRKASAESGTLFADDDDDDSDDNVDSGISGENDDERKGVEHNGYIQKFIKEVSDRALVQINNADVSTMYVAKYNRFVDTILSRINKILREKYDPVTVKLTSSSNSTKTYKKGKTGNTVKRKLNVKGTKKKSTKSPAASKVDTRTSSETGQAEVAHKQTKNEKKSAQEGRASTEKESQPKKSTNKTKNTITKKETSNKKGTTATTASSNSKKNVKKEKSRAKATLYGLASLKRSGDVSVNMMSDHTTIRTKFNLGPLMLKVEKEFGRSSRKEVRSATATTAEMSGRLSLRVYHGGAATLHSIRVLQPKQMRIDSSDENNKTRKYVRESSSHIAHLVSEKLSAVTRAMLEPKPKNNSISAPHST